MKYYMTSSTEQKLSLLFIMLMGTTLSAWVGFVIWEGMNHQVAWWMAIMPASLLLACAFCMDASSTIRFGRKLIIAWESSPIMSTMARRYGVMHGIAAQAAAEVCFLACLPLILPGMPAHHVLLGAITMMAAAHCYAWQSNNRYWRWSAC